MVLPCILPVPGCNQKKTLISVISLSIFRIFVSLSITAPLFATPPQSQRETITSTRASFVSSIVTSLLVASSVPSTAQAAKYGSFGTDSTTGAITPQTAEIDTELLKSSSVKDAISAIQKVRTAVTNVQTSLASNPQSNVVATSMIGDPYKVRESCNIINTILDEDTQRYTDRLIRNIVQDLIEIDTAATQKEGIARSARRYDNVQNKLTKLAKSIDELLAFTV